MNQPESDLTEKLYADCIVKWHTNEHLEDSLIGNYEGVYKIIYTLHLFNYRLWHQEDIARRTDVKTKVIADVKRKIDKLNQARNDAIERIDNELCKMVTTPNPFLPMNSETPGSIIDRMSIISLRIYHMEEETKRKNVSSLKDVSEHIKSCQAKLEILKEQLRDLKNCLWVLIDEIFTGKKQLKVYRQFKMYNDPTLNPQLYKQG